MTNLNNIVLGLKKFVDSEMLPKVSGLNKWIVGAGISLALENSSNIFDSLKQNDFIKALNIINKDDEIDLDKIYESLIEQAKKSAVTFDMPLVGVVTLKEKDLEKIYKFIKES